MNKKTILNPQKSTVLGYLLQKLVELVFPNSVKFGAVW